MNAHHCVLFCFVYCLSTHQVPLVACETGLALSLSSPAALIFFKVGEAHRSIMGHSCAPIRTTDLHGPDSEFEDLSPTVGSLSACTSDTYKAFSRSLPDLSSMTLCEQDVWVLNKSSRSGEHEKFFVTFTEHPGCGRWLAITCHYRNVEPNSLEEVLMTLPSAQARSMVIYATLRPHLHLIRFHEHVTHLDLRTTDGKLNLLVAPGPEDCLHAYPHACLRPANPQDTASGLTGPRVEQQSRHGDGHLREQEERPKSRGSLYQEDEEEKRERQLFEREPTVVAELEGEINGGGRSTLLSRIV